MSDPTFGHVVEAKSERVGVVGLGYVGLRVAMAMSNAFHTVGFDLDSTRVAALREGCDVHDDVTSSELASSTVVFTTNVDELARCTVIVVAVPTPVNANQKPDLAALSSATELVASQLRVGTVVVFESTVYPGLTEAHCGPLLERASGLQLGRDIFLAYSPERINPGDEAHGFESVRKVVAAQDERTLERVAQVYSAVVRAGVHRAPSIAVAEASKILENAQRDVNIALMNEFALVFDGLGLRTADVLSAARTKWNFQNFVPGLVGGPCVGVAPHYFSALAAKQGQSADVVLAARRTNDSVAEFVGRKVMALIRERSLPAHLAKVGVLGVTFKENVTDVRNSAVPRMLAVLLESGVRPLVHDPLASEGGVQRACGVDACEFRALTQLDVLIYAVNHRFYDAYDLTSLMAPNGVFVDVKSKYDPRLVEGKGLSYWSL